MFWIPAFAGMTIIELLKRTPTTGGLTFINKKASHNRRWEVWIA